VPADHTRLVEDLHNCFVLFLPWAWNSLDSKLWRGGDVDVVQQIPQSTSGDQSFISDSLDFIGLIVHLLLLGIAQRSVVLIIFIFIVAFFFFILDVFFFFLMIVIVVVVVILRQLLKFLSVFSCWYRDHDLEGILVLSNVLKRVGLQLWLRWHISWRHLTSGLTSSALEGCATRMNHLKFENMRE
jgi:hypothetical protein